MSSQYYDKDQVDQKLSQNLDRVEEVGKEVKLDVTKDVKAEVETFTASTTTKVNTLEGKVNQLDSKTTELNSSVAVYNQKVDNLNSAVSSETSTISIKPTDTATYLATLPNAVYRAASAGTYQFTTLPDFDVVVNKVVPEGYSVKFLKDASGWSVSVVEKLPMQDLTPVINEVTNINNAFYFSEKNKIIKRDYKISSELIIFSLGTMHFFKVSNGQNLRISRPAVQGNRFRIMKIIKESEPTNGDQLIDVYNDTENVNLTYDWQSDIDGWMCVYLHNGELINIDLDIERAIYTPYAKGLIKENEPLAPSGNDVYMELNSLKKTLIVDSLPIYKRCSIDANLKIQTSAGLIVFFKVSNGQNLRISRSSIQGNRFRIMKIVKESEPTNGDQLIDVYNDTANVNLTYDWQSDIDGWMCVYLVTGNGYDSDINYSVNVTRIAESRDLMINESPLKKVTINLERGSLSLTGSLPSYVDTKEWKDNEFYNNVRFLKFINLKTNHIKVANFSELTNYDVRIFEFDSDFRFIKTNIVDSSSKFSLTSNCRKVKFHLKRKDNSKISDVNQVKLIVESIFDSEIYSYEQSTYGATQRALVSVKPNLGRDFLEKVNVISDYQLDNEDYYTNIYFRTPIDYLNNSIPKRVIMFAHSSDKAHLSDFNPTYLPYVKYIVDEDYIVVDVFAWTNKQSDGVQYSATPTNIACVNAMYKFLSDNFNIKRDGVYVFGKSRGGFQAYTAEYHFSFPILAVGSLAGAMYPFKNNYGYTTSDINTAMIDLGITEDLTSISKEGGADYREESQIFFKKNFSKFVGYMPMFMGAIDVNSESVIPNVRNWNTFDFTAISRVPTKTWVSPDDPIGVPEILCRKRAVDKGNGVFEVRFMQSGSGDPHHTVDTAGPFIDIITKSNISHRDIPVAWVEMLQFFKRYEI